MTTGSPLTVSLTQASGTCIQYHIAQRGEWLSRLTRLYVTTWQYLASINGHIPIPASPTPPLLPLFTHLRRIPSLDGLHHDCR